MQSIRMLFFVYMNSNARRSTIILINLLLFQGFIIALNLLVTFSQFTENVHISVVNVTRITLALSVITVIVCVLLISEIARLADKENEAGLNALRLQESQQLIDVLRTHRHDFINHIQVIYGLAQLGQIERLGKYVNELASNLKVESKQSQVSPPELAALFIKKASLAAVKGIRFDVEIDPNLNGLDSCIMDIIRILGNLIDNAFDAVAASGIPEMQVRVKVAAQPGGYLITVSNSGPEIPEEIKKSIFEKGFSTKGTGGSGLGLYITKELVEKYRGEISLMAASDYSTNFIIKLPAARGS